MDDVENVGLPLLAGDPRVVGSFEARARLDDTPAGVVFLGEWAGEVPAVMAVLRPAVAADPAAVDRFETAVGTWAEDQVLLGLVLRGLVTWVALPIEARGAAIAFLRATQPETADAQAHAEAVEAPVAQAGVGQPQAVSAAAPPTPAVKDDSPWELRVGMVMVLSWVALVVYEIVRWVG